MQFQILPRPKHERPIKGTEVEYKDNFKETDLNPNVEGPAEKERIRMKMMRGIMADKECNANNKKKIIEQMKKGSVNLLQPSNLSNLNDKNIFQQTVIF